LAPHGHEVVDAEDRHNPPAANTASANGTSTAPSGLVTSSFSGSVVSNVNFIASELGVGDGEAFATCRAYGPGPTFADRGADVRPDPSRR
jgi:hypothetical protein